MFCRRIASHQPLSSHDYSPWETVLGNGFLCVLGTGGGEKAFGKKEISPFVLWFTGLPGSGKTTLANAVYEKLSVNGYRLERLDGDKVRSIFPATGFSKEERDIQSNV